MNLKFQLQNKGYVSAVSAIGIILNKIMANKEIEEIFNHYLDELCATEESAAILTLAEVIKGCGALPSDKERPIQDAVEGEDRAKEESQREPA